MLAGEPGIDVAAIRRWAAGRLAAFKVPRYVELVAELPHTPTGRVAKHELPAALTGNEIDVESRTGEHQSP